ncbi:aminotransferase class IV [Clostridium formicaceticum]|uniref:Branched-chain-amino-acid aminotransferase n=1 Tax=Clostridium formicaceticum TaxID=1497 RepID=A0AAC9WFG9_9CLOT|nr:aminotransferase class IV [Clostridium formicaceticum]AOY76312.1 hypothetical protein BJL90_10595 [Clostridium formicaceticum]ARE86699.1 Branched-chain-amino-acid aminotransferase [Clostridium formicaceticum]
MYISINGHLTSQEEARITPLSEGLSYGYGVFETIKFQGETIYFLREHVERLKDGCRKINLLLDIEVGAIKKHCSELVQKNHLVTGALKISCIKNGEEKYIILSTRENKYTSKDYKKGFKLCFTDIKRNPYSVLTYIKSNNYMENFLARQQALNNDYDEVIFTNFHGEICEGALSNIFFVKKGILHTPSIDCGILPGIMRQKIIDITGDIKLPIVIGKYTIEDIMMAEEIFITNSLLEIMPICQIQDKKIDLQKNIITQTLMRHYNQYIATLD